MACGFCGSGGTRSGSGGCRGCTCTGGSAAVGNGAFANNNGCIGGVAGRNLSGCSCGAGINNRGVNGLNNAFRNGCNCRRNCAGMGRCSTRGTDAAAAAAAVAAQARNEQNCCAQAARQAENCCNPCCVSPQTGTVGEELYGGRNTRNVVLTTCCDPGCGCREYNIADRCPFWPTFAHPRWLSCDQLYGRRRCR